MIRLLFNSVDPNIYLFVVKCDESLDVCTLNDGTAVPPHNVLAHIAIWKVHRVVVSHTLLSGRSTDLTQ
jgi:hypothetical protein